MPEPEDQKPDATSAPASTAQGDQQGIVDSPADWKRAIESISDPDLKAALSKKIEGYDRFLTKKTQELSKREQEIAQVAQNLKAASAKPSGQSTEQKLKIIDAQIEKTDDPATREGLRQLKDSIVEIAEDKIKVLKAEMDKRFEEIKFSSQSSIKSALAKDFKALEEVYGEELIEKYKEGIESNSLQYPGAYSSDRWLHTLAEPDELRQALRIRLKRESDKPNGDKPPAEKKPASQPATSTKPSADLEKYKGKNPAQVRLGFGKALDDGWEAGMKKLGLSR